MRSDEAAAYYLSKGTTNNLKLATIIDATPDEYLIKPKSELQMDAELRSQIRDALGFDFTVHIDPQLPYVRLVSDQAPIVATRAKTFEGDISDDNLLTNQDALDRVFAAIERLKTKWDKAVAQDRNDIVDID